MFPPGSVRALNSGRTSFARGFSEIISEAYIMPEVPRVAFITTAEKPMPSESLIRPYL
jgi:hypothetical protein